MRQVKKQAVFERTVGRDAGAGQAGRGLPALPVWLKSGAFASTASWAVDNTGELLVCTCECSRCCVGHSWLATLR
jgi:hypothetical protein